VLRHVSDVRIGRVNPKTLSIGINVERRSSTSRGCCATPSTADAWPSWCREAEPKFVQYRNLKAAYARYRVLAADSTIATVTATRAIRPGEAFAGVDVLRRAASRVR
jgi:murein L,D-transpeptidase YcbB/YkuD